jgi:uncharacterized protein (TIGR02301 family)
MARLISNARRCAVFATVLLAAGLALAASEPALAQSSGSSSRAAPAPPPPAPSADSRPYDEKLVRLAEILGAVHYLRELCGANDGQLWRDRMRELVDAEGSSASRRAKLSRGFNQGYQSYSRTYRTCTPPAQGTITRFLAEGEQIADGLVRTVP